MDRCQRHPPAFPARTVEVGLGHPMDDQPGGRLGLAPITLEDRISFQSAFARLAQPISDYSFSNIYAWSSALRLYQARLHRHLCIFADGLGDLTMLLPPIPEQDAGSDDLRRALGDCFEIMDAFNDAHSHRAVSRIEYISDEMLERINEACPASLPLSASPMSGDYLYACDQMIHLPGGALKSKRHARSKFIRDFPNHRIEPLREEHLPGCYGLLDLWHKASDDSHRGQVTEDDSHTATNDLRQREARACRRALQLREALGLRGISLLVDDKIVGFTLGEQLSPSQASILFEKTHPDYHGSAQFIFSEFCRLNWSDVPEINVGDDWGIPTLRFTKESYRPVRRLGKYTLSKPAVASPVISLPSAPATRTLEETPAEPDVSETLLVSTPRLEALEPQPARAAVAEPVVELRRAKVADVPALTQIELLCFEPVDAFNGRQIRGLIQNDHVINDVVTVDGEVAGWCVGLVRKHRRHRSGRVYGLAVHPNFRSRGLGGKLMQSLLNHLRNRAVRHVYLEVRADNDRAISLYQNLGFQRVRKLHDYYGSGIDGVSMRLTLTGETKTPAQPLLFPALAAV